MSWTLIWSGGLAATFFALGFNVILPLDPSLASLCDMTGIAASLVFVALADGA
ncbi:MAG TPA: hypothetical protein VFE63_13215 [Roseiarcus sp.]|nr:hypothetical protein [Roseiarcus sp.]